MTTQQIPIIEASFDGILQHLAAGDLPALTRDLAPFSATELVPLFERLDLRQRAVLFRLLSKQRAVELFEALPPSLQGDLLAGLQNTEVSRLFTELDPDDRLWLLDEVPSVLATLDRTHDPERVPQAVAWAREAGLDVSLDLIYGTPGETLADVETSVRAALACEPDHLSAYSLIIEGNTAMARRLRRGEIEAPDPDDMADKYELIDDLTSADGLSWYEVSNFATDESGYCRHNLGYWRGGDWWGVGPGAHSHVAGARWWNLKHPARYAAACDAGELPVDGGEKLDDDDRHLELIMTGLRLAEGLADSAFTTEERRRADEQVEAGLLRRRREQDGGGSGYALTEAGRLLADGVVRDILP